MKSLVDLKKEILNDELQHLYVFTGEEFMIRKIYYQKISQKHGILKSFSTVEGIYKELEKHSLFAQKTVNLCYNDYDFLKQKESTFRKFINLCEKNKNTIVILIFDELSDKSVFYKVFDNYITSFNRVTKDIAVKYVGKLFKNNLSLDQAQNIAFNCDYLYSNILLEADKYNLLTEEGLQDKYSEIGLVKEIVPTAKDFAVQFLTRNRYELVDSYKVLLKENILSYLPELYNTFLIALFVKYYGKWNGSGKAYEAGEYWGRVKQIRELPIPYNANTIYEILKEINKLDLDVRSGRMNTKYAWDYLIGVIL